MRWRYLLGAGLALTLALLTTPTDTFAQAANAGYVNVSGTSDGGRVITIELRTTAARLMGQRGSTLLAQTTYTTQANDTEETIADELVDNFSQAGYKAKRVKDKANGEEVIYFKRETNGKQFVVNVVEDDPDVDVTVKGTYSGAAAPRLGNPGRSCSVTPDRIDFGSGSAQLQLHGEGTTWLTDITGVEVRDLVNVISTNVINDSLIVIDITYGSNITSDPIHVDVFGTAFDDDSILENDIVHDVTVNPLIIRPLTRAPGLTLPMVVVVGTLLAIGTAWTVRRRARSAG